MKLYVNVDMTKWAGTQVDAKKEFGKIEPYEVPVDKAGLITFLNTLCRSAAPIDAGIPPVVISEYTSSVQAAANPPNDTLVGRCSMVELKELSTMMNVLINKTWNSMDRLGDKSA